MPFVRPDVEAFLGFVNSAPGPAMHEVDAATARAQYTAMTGMTERPRPALARVEDIELPSPHGHRMRARVYVPHGRGEPSAVVAFFHGGGWVIGDLDTHDALCGEIAAGLGLTLVAVDYRLAPEHPFPAAADDALAAVRWLANSPPGIGHPVSGLVLAGDSAGGNLAAVCAQQLAGTLSVPVLAQWLIYPGVDMDAEGGSMAEFAEGYLLSATGMAWFGSHYMPDRAHSRHDHASPLHADRFAGQPAALVFTCGLDPLRDQGRDYAGKLIRHGVAVRFREAAGQIHGCFTLRQAIPSAQGDLLACLADLKDIVVEAQGDATMRQASGAQASPAAIAAQ